MSPEQQKSILAIALFAAFADGAKHDREREEIRRIAESLGSEAGAPDLARLYQDVLLKRVTLEAAAAALVEPGERQLAYEMAVCVCDADGRQSEAEQRFLNALKALLKLNAEQAAAFEREANVIVELSEAAGKSLGKAGSAATGMAFSFATTYALGQLAKRYYAGGRVMNTQMLRDTFQNLLGPAKQMQTQYLPQIQQQAGTLDMGRVMAMVRGA